MKDGTLKLSKLTIELQRWGENRGHYEAVIEYEGCAGGVKLVLDNGVSAALLARTGEVIQEFSNKAAEQLRQSVEQSVLEATRSPALLAESRTETQPQ